MATVSVRILQPNREAWIAAARRFKEALRTNPNMRVRFFGTCRETVSGQTLNCDEVIVPLNQTVGGSGNAINESVIAGATEAQLREPGAAIEYTALMWLDNQIAMGGVTDSSIPWGWILGIAAVGGAAAYLVRKDRSPRLALRGLDGIQSEHVKKAKEYARTAEKLAKQKDFIGSFEKASQAIVECSWSGLDWPSNECIKAHQTWGSSGGALLIALEAYRSRKRR